MLLLVVCQLTTAAFGGLYMVAQKQEKLTQHSPSRWKQYGEYDYTTKRRKRKQINIKELTFPTRKLVKIINLIAQVRNFSCFTNLSPSYMLMYVSGVSCQSQHGLAAAATCIRTHKYIIALSLYQKKIYLIIHVRTKVIS